jgi:dihydroxy-acid dehydratase
MIGHVSPEAAVGGMLAMVKDGDVITIDAKGKGLSVASDESLPVAR